MKIGLAFFAFITMGLAVMSSGCATKKYARTQVDNRVAPLEHRTGEVEDTTRRNNQDIAKLDGVIKDVRADADRAQNKAERAQSKADQANSKASAAEQSVAELRANLDQYSLQSTATVNFGFDHYDLTPQARASLDQLAMQIKDRNNYILEIEGFADSVGTNSYNDQLTQKRAESVRRYLAEQQGIPLFRMHILGFGESRPVADNHTSAGRAQNRRVEVRLLTRNATANPSARS